MSETRHFPWDIEPSKPLIHDFLFRFWISYLASWISLLLSAATLESLGTSLLSAAICTLMIVVIINLVIHGWSVWCSYGIHHGSYNPRHWVGTESAYFSIDISVKILDNYASHGFSHYPPYPLILKSEIEWCRHNCRGRWKIGWNNIFFSRKTDLALFMVTNGVSNE